MTTSSIILKSMTLKPITPLMSPALWIATCLTLLLIACGGGGKVTPPPPPTTYVLTVNSASPASSVSIAVTPSDNNNSGNGATSFTRTYNAGTSVTLTAPATAGGNPFSSWSGCTTASTVNCTVILNAGTTVMPATPPPRSLTMSAAPAVTRPTASPPPPPSSPSSTPQTSPSPATPSTS